MWITAYKCMKKRKTYINFKFSGEDKRDQNNKVSDDFLHAILEVEQSVPINRPIPI